MRYALGLSYDGSDFAGWQRQPDLPTVQSCVEQALSQVANHDVRVAVAGRTDRGVHATGQVVSFASGAPRKTRDWLRGGNALTPSSIELQWLEPVDEQFHARYSAVARRYVYVFADQPQRDPLLRNSTWQCPRLDADAMHRAAQQLVGEHDFSAVRGAGCQSISPMRRVNVCRVLRKGNFVALEIEANAFLLHMVRNIAALLADVGQHKCGEDIQRLLSARDRSLVGATAPAQGLYLTQVRYDVALPTGAIPSVLAAS